MKLLLVGSAGGGACKSTLCVRLAESLSKRSIATCVVDLSPWPTAHLLADERTAVIRGTGASSSIGAESILRPYRESHQLAIIDTGRLDEPELQAWLPLLDGVLLTTGMSLHAINSLPKAWTGIDRLRNTNSQAKRLGLLPVQTTASDHGTLAKLRVRFPGQFMDQEIPFDAEEPRRVQRTCLHGVSAEFDSRRKAARYWDDIASHVMSELGLQAKVPVAEQKTETKGVLSRLWKESLRRLKGGPKVTAGVSTA